MSIKPVLDNIVVSATPAEEETESGLIIPTAAQEISQEGTVIAVGDGVHQNGELIPLSVVSGDYVVFRKGAGTSLKVDGEEVVVIKERDILVKLT